MELPEHYSSDVLFFFDGHPAELALYEALFRRMEETFPAGRVKVQKTQITFYKKRLFACVSFARVRKAAQLPDPYMVVTFGLEHRIESPRIDIATEPYPNRWTHHVVVYKEEEIDEELLGWIKEAAAIAETKKRKKKG